MKFLKKAYDFINSPGALALAAILIIILEELTERTLRGQVYILVFVFASFLVRAIQLLEQVVENGRKP